MNCFVDLRNVEKKSVKQSTIVTIQDIKRNDFKNDKGGLILDSVLNANNIKLHIIIHTIDKNILSLISSNDDTVQIHWKETHFNLSVVLSPDTFLPFSVTITKKNYQIELSGASIDEAEIKLSTAISNYKRKNIGQGSNKLFEIYKRTSGEFVFVRNRLTEASFQKKENSYHLKERLRSSNIEAIIDVTLPVSSLTNNGMIFGSAFEIVHYPDSISLIFKDNVNKDMPFCVSGTVGEAKYYFFMDWSEETWHKRRTKELNPVIQNKGKNGYDGINLSIVSGQRYYREINKHNSLFYCDNCKRYKRTNPYYYIKNPSEQLFCSDCFGIIKKKVKEEEAARIQKQIDNAEILPEGFEIYVGKKKHGCSNGTSTLKRKYYKLYKDDGSIQAIQLMQCVECGRIFAIADAHVEPFHKYNLVTIIKKTKPEEKKKTIEKPTIKKEVKKPEPSVLPAEIRPFKIIKYTDIITRSTIRECTNKNHILTDIDIEVKVMMGDYSVVSEKIPAIWCKSCRKYYILENEYRHLNRRGTILCNVVEKNFWLSKNRQQEFLISNGESLLHKMGYNVNAYSNVPKNTRWKILRAAMESGLLTKGEIMSHLNTLISRGKARYSFRFAVEKWETDLEYVRSLSLIHDSAYTFKAKSITHNKYNKKQN